MKKIDTSQITTTSRLPFIKAVVDHMQESVYEVIDALTKGLNGAVSGVTIISGCVATGNSVTAGSIYYQGEIYLVDAITTLDITSAYWVEINTFRLEDPLQYSDAAFKNTTQIRKFTLQDGVGISTYNSASRLPNIIALNAAVIANNASISLEISNRTNALNALTIALINETSARTLADSSINSALTNESIARANADSLKANNAQLPWTNLTLQNSAADDGPANYAYSPAYLKDTIGFVHLRGWIQSNVAGGSIVATLPPGYRPTAILIYFIKSVITNNIMQVSINSAGQITIISASSTDIATLEAIGSFYPG